MSFQTDANVKDVRILVSLGRVIVALVRNWIVGHIKLIDYSNLWEGYTMKLTQLLQIVKSTSKQSKHWRREKGSDLITCPCADVYDNKPSLHWFGHQAISDYLNAAPDNTHAKFIEWLDQCIAITENGED